MGFNSPHSLERKKQKHCGAVNTATAERPRLWPIAQQRISQHTAFQKKPFPLPLPKPRTSSPLNPFLIYKDQGIKEQVDPTQLCTVP